MRVVIINPNSTEAMTQSMLAVARLAVPDVAFTGWTSTLGPASIQGPQDGLLAEPPLLALVEKAAADGFQGVIIGCFDDTALTNAAQRFPGPVLGIGQAAYHMAALRQWRFSVVTTLGVSVPILQDNIAQYGLQAACVRVRASEVPVLMLEHDPAEAEAQITAEALRAVAEDRPDCIVLGCAGMAKLTADMRARLTIPVIDGVESAARLIRAMGP